jgi:hypothetical protein
MIGTAGGETERMIGTAGLLLQFLDNRGVFLQECKARVREQARVDTYPRGMWREQQSGVAFKKSDTISEECRGELSPASHLANQL